MYVTETIIDSTHRLVMLRKGNYSENVIFNLHRIQSGSVWWSSLNADLCLYYKFGGCLAKDGTFLFSVQITI